MSRNDPPLSAARPKASEPKLTVAIIAGGSGTRLWPLSTPEYPKHLLAINNNQTLLQLTYARAQALSDSIYVLTERSHSDLVQQQLPDLAEANIIIEPARKGTASVIMLGLHYIKSHQEDGEPVVFFHADHHLTDVEGFVLSAKTAASASKGNQAIALVGIEPRYPATGFGYIKKGERHTDHSDLPIYKVERFKEKPDLRTAQEYLRSGKYLWNMGLFAAPIAVFEAAVAKHNPKLFSRYQKLAKAANPDNIYAEFEEQPIDTALIEKADNILVVPGTFNWADVGSFSDIYEVVALDEGGNFCEGDNMLNDTKNSYVHNSDDKPMLVIGMENVVVISTKAGILVCDRDRAQAVGATIKQYWKTRSSAKK